MLKARKRVPRSVCAFIAICSVAACFNLFESFVSNANAQIIQPARNPTRLAQSTRTSPASKPTVNPQIVNPIVQPSNLAYGFEANQFDTRTQFAIPAEELTIIEPVEARPSFRRDVPDELPIDSMVQPATPSQPKLPPLDSDPEIRQSVLLRAARLAVSMQDVPLAIERFEELFAEYPDYNEVKAEYVGLLIQMRALPKAQKVLEAALKTDPYQVDLQTLYADVLLQQDMHQAAEQTLRNMLDRDQASLELVIKLARVLAWQNKYQEAVMLYESRLANLGVVPPAFLSSISSLLLELKRPNEALVMFRQLQQETPTDPIPVAGMLQAAVQLGDETAAFQYLEMLQHNAAFTPQQQIELGDTFYRDGHDRFAILLYQSASQLTPNDAFVSEKLVRAYVRSFDMRSAYSVIQALGPNRADRIARLAKAHYCTAVGEHAEALAIYHSLLKQDPGDVLALEDLGILFHTIGDYREAETHFRQAIKVSPYDQELKQLLADSLLEQLRIEEATSVLVAQSNQYSSTMQGAESIGNAAAVADLMVRAKDYVAAEAICGSALQRPSDMAFQPAIVNQQSILAIQTVMGFALLKQGRNSEALDTFMQAKQLPWGNTPKLRYGLYCAYANLDRFAEAESVLADELRSFAPLTKERVIIAQLAMQDCNCGLASRILEQAVMFDRHDPFLSLLLAEAKSMCNRCSGDCDDQSHFQTVLRQSPGNTRAQLGLARSYARTNVYDASSVYYNKLLSSLPQHALARIEYARLNYAWKGADDANCVYGTALSYYRPDSYLPDFGDSDVELDLLHVAHNQAGLRSQLIQSEKNAKYFKDWKPLQSIMHYEMLVQMDPTNQEAQFDLAQGYAGLNRTRDAIAQYDCLLNLEPCHIEAQIARYRTYLETRPQILDTFEFEYNAGRQGLTDITQLRLETLAMKPIGDQDEFLIAGYAHRFLWPRQGTAVDGNVGIIGFQTKPYDYLNIFATAEVEQYDFGFSTRVPFRAGMRYRTPNDARISLTGFLENIPVNGESIRQDTHRGGFELSCAKYITWRWELDSMYRYATYSDHNSMHEALFRSDYMIVPGRRQLRAKVDLTLMSFDEQTAFSASPDLFGTLHPYFSPSGFTYVTAGLESRFWLSPHNFRGANEHWYSGYIGARVDSDSVGYGLLQFAAHRDYRSWLTGHLAASSILSSVYDSVGISGMLTIRFP
jgi:tetratricopeptide (TPR) repeat protein